MALTILPGVFRPRSDTVMLRDELLAEPLEGAAVLELCVGPGLVAVAAARAGARVTAVDVSRRTVATARWNAWKQRVGIDVRCGDLFEPVRGRRFDLVVANPPYVPSGPDLPRRGPSRAWAAGTDGRAILDRLIRGVPDHLRSGGRVLLVHSSLIGEERTLADLRGLGLDASVVARARGPLGPLMERQRKAGRIVSPDGAEDVIVVRAAAPPDRR